MDDCEIAYRILVLVIISKVSLLRVSPAQYFRQCPFQPMLSLEHGVVTPEEKYYGAMGQSRILSFFMLVLT